MRKTKLKGLALLSTLVLLAACQEQKESEPQDIDLPTVEDKYDATTITEFNLDRKNEETNSYENLVINKHKLLTKPKNLPKSLFYDSGIDIDYPQDGVKGLYVTTDNILDKDTFNDVYHLVGTTDLNTLVIDFKDDSGQITTKLQTDNPLIEDSIWGVLDLPQLLKQLEAKKIYPIARIVTFKDYKLAENRPDLSFHDKKTGEIWADGNGAMFTNPYLQEVWDYNVEIAIEAAKMGFKEIQFDYLRFPEGFHIFDSELDYDLGPYKDLISTNPDHFGQERVAAINDFLEYASQRLAPYGVEVSADVFGYTAIAIDHPDTRGIGQNFVSIAERVDVISSMIYPSHWDLGFFGIMYPDLEPYKLVDEYMTAEDKLLANINSSVTSRPWLQDFTDFWLAPGTYQQYSTSQVQAQIDALKDHGIYEFLLWNVDGDYSQGVDYAPEKSNKPSVLGTPEGGLAAEAESNENIEILQESSFD